MNSKILFLCAAFVASVPAFAHAENGSLSLDSAIHQTLAYSPKLKAARENINASRGSHLQSTQIPNPEFSAEAENILGSGSSRGLSEAEITLGIAQPIEMGGKRDARRKAADDQISLAELQYRAAALDTIRDTTIAWAEIIAAHEDVRLAQDQHELASGVLKSVSKRVAAAAEPAIQQSKSEIALASSRITLQKAEQNLERARKSLSQLWGENTLNEAPDSEVFFEITKPDLENDTSIDSNPDIAILQADIALASANLGIERANAVPDVTVGIGVRDSRETNSQSLLASLSIPIPVFNQNQGAILKAGHEIAKAEHEKSASILAIKTALTHAKNVLETSYLEAESLQKDLLPAAEKSFSQARRGYQAGKFSYLEVLDAQRTLAEVRAQHISALKQYHTALAQFDRLTGKNIDHINGHGDKK